MVEVLDDRHFHAGGLETDEALVGVAQQRRRQASISSSGWASKVMTAGRAPAR